MLILGIESSCDETAAAVVRDGVEIRSSVIASQVDVHRRFGGVVPELASRGHIDAIVPVTRAALQDAGIVNSDLDAVAATRGPGLVGALLVGFTFARAFAYALEIPFVGVNHLESHVNALFLAPDPPPFPFVALLASGGHTSLYKVLSHTEFEIMGRTRDDAAGEAYDKVSKMLGLGYPGGKVIDDLAAAGDPARIHFTRPYVDKDGFDFSFSGIKTAVNRYIQRHPEEYRDQIPDIAAGFQAAVIDVLTFKLVAAARAAGGRRMAVVGGVAANRGLRERLRAEADANGLVLHVPPMELCGDNAAMIAATGYHLLQKGVRSGLNDDVYSRVNASIPSGLSKKQENAPA